MIRSVREDPLSCSSDDNRGERRRDLRSNIVYLAWGREDSGTLLRNLTSEFIALGRSLKSLVSAYITFGVASDGNHLCRTDFGGVGASTIIGS